MANYKPTGIYNDAALSEEDKKKVEALGQQWRAANAAGNTAVADQFHADAEKIRAGYGYSGGNDGSEYRPLDTAPAATNPTGYQAAQLPTYVPQENAVNSMFDAAREANVAALEAAYQNSRSAVEAQKAKIPGIYQEQANALSADAERQNLNFNEYAAVSGINTGAGSQARLAQNVVNQQNMGALRKSAADAVKDAEVELSRLYTEYQNSIAAAVANNEYEKAAALLSEYQRAAESTVTVAQAQADENYRAYNAGINANQYQQETTAENADRLASYGDFSGYSAMGYTPEQIAMMQQAWNAANPDIAFATGRISAAEYARLVPQTPAGAGGEDGGVINIKNYTLDGVPKMIYDRAVEEYAKTQNPETALDFIDRYANNATDKATLLVALADKDKTFKEYMVNNGYLVS